MNSRSHQRAQQVFNAGSTVNYTYDPIGQLKVADSATASEDRGYLYDAAWNLNYRTNNTAALAFTVNNRNEVTKVGSADYHYDGNGNRVDIREDLPWYGYDDENRLIEVENDGSGWRSEFTYDGTGRLRQRLEYTGAPGNWTLATTTRYVYDAWRVIQERNGSDVPQVSYTRGPDLSGTLEGAGGIGGLLARSHGYSSGNWSTHNFYHADGNGNVTYLVNSSQTLAAKYRYDPYGNTISSSGSLAGANVYRFSSKELHVNSGLYYYGFRFYDPNTQSWLNRDPLEEAGGINLYGFVRNDPLNDFDPYGLQSPHAAVGVAIGSGNVAQMTALLEIAGEIGLSAGEVAALRAAIAAAAAGGAIVICETRQYGKGERNRQHESDNPWKGWRVDPKDPTKIRGKDQNGKDVVKPRPPGFPDPKPQPPKPNPPKPPEGGK